MYACSYINYDLNNIIDIYIDLITITYKMLLN